VTLQGGSAGLSEEARHEETDLEKRVQISFGADNEHFSLTGEFRSKGAEVLAVFAWRGRARAAE
jgi:hypothetical protein